MRIALASAPVMDNEIEFNKKCILNTMEQCSGKADLVVFGESVLQGFNCLSWDYHADCRVAVSQTEDPITQICQAAKQFGIAVSFGYIEKAGGNAKPECGYRSVAGVV